MIGILKLIMDLDVLLILEYRTQAFPEKIYTSTTILKFVVEMLVCFEGRYPD